MKKQGLLLLPGGGMSSWVWKSLIPLLKYDVIAPEYRLSENTYENRRYSRINDSVQYHLSLISDFNSVVLIAHSGSGILASKIADQIPEKVSGVIYLSANIPKYGKSTIENLPFLVRQLNKRAIRNQVKRDATPLIKAEKVVRKYFCNTSTEDVIQYVLRQNLLSEPLCMAFEKLVMEDLSDIPKMYIILTEDKSQSVRSQYRMASHLNIENIVHIQSDHMVMLSQPEVLSKHVNDFVKAVE